MDTNPAAEVTIDPEAQLEEIFSRSEPKAEKPKAEKPEERPAEDDEAEEPQDSTDEPEADEEVSDDQPETPTDDEDVDIDGEVFKLPKKVKEAVLRTKDYTQKTQALASQRQIVQDREQFVEAREQIISAAFKEASELQAMQTQLAQFDALDWNTLINNDPAHAMRLNFAKQQLQSSLVAKQKAVDGIVQHATKAREQHAEKQKELGRAELVRRLGNITEADRSAMLGLGHELGFDDRDLMSPAAINALHLAAKYQTLQKAKPGIEKRAATAKPMTAPAARSGHKSSEAAKTDDLRSRYRKSGRSDDVEAFLAARIEAKRKR